LGEPINQPALKRGQTVEIIGPPGIGKSKLFWALSKKWTPRKNWIYDDMLLAPKKPGILKPVQWINYQYRLYSGKNLTKSLSNDFGIRFIQNNQALADFCWTVLTENPQHNSLESRYRHAYFIFVNFCGYQAIAEKGSHKPCLIEEGLFQKSFLIQEDRQMMEDLVEEYLSVLPLPKAMVGLDSADTELILKRIKGRKKIIPSHNNKDEAGLRKDIENWQYLVQLMLDKLEKKNVLVYKIDGGKPLEEKVAILEPILQSLNE